MHRRPKPIFWVPGQARQVLGKLGGTRLHIITSDKTLSDHDQDKILDLMSPNVSSNSVDGFV